MVVGPTGPDDKLVRWLGQCFDELSTALRKGGVKVAR
jgi:hypothetical protein